MKTNNTLEKRKAIKKIKKKPNQDKTKTKTKTNKQTRKTNQWSTTHYTEN